MNQIIKLKLWILDWLIKEDCKPLFICIFGSVVISETQANDYDILFVINNSMDKIFWLEITKRKNKFIMDGNKYFDKKLHLTILTKREVEEEPPFLNHLKSQPYISILGDLDNL